MAHCFYMCLTNATPIYYNNFCPTKVLHCQKLPQCSWPNKECNLPHILWAPYTFSMGTQASSFRSNVEDEKYISCVLLSQSSTKMVPWKYSSSNLRKLWHQTSLLKKTPYLRKILYCWHWSIDLCFAIWLSSATIHYLLFSMVVPKGGNEQA